MSIAIVSHGVKQSPDGNTTTSAAIDTSGANFLALVIADYFGQTASVISDSYSNSWVMRSTYSDSAVCRVRIGYVKAATVGSGHTFTATQTGCYCAFAFAAFSGVDTAAPYDVENGVGDASTASKAPGSVTPSVNGELLIFGGNWGTAGTPDSLSVNNGFTIADSAANVSGQAFGTMLAYLVQGTAGAINPTASWSTITNMAVAIATFKEGAGDILLPQVLL